ARGQRRRRAGEDDERDARLLAAHEGARRLAIRHRTEPYGRLVRQPASERAADLPSVLIREGQNVGARAARVGAVQAREREAGHGDDDDRRQSEEDEPGPIAGEQAEVLLERGGETAQHHGATPRPSSSRSARPVRAKNTSARFGRWSVNSSTSAPARAADRRTAGTVAESGTASVSSRSVTVICCAPGTAASQPAGSGRTVRSRRRGGLPVAATRAAGE